MRLASYLDTEQSKKAADVVVKKGRLLGCTLYIVGVVFLVMLPNEKFSRRNFFDENALMAGLVKREFTDLGSLADFASKLKAVASDEHSYMRMLEVEFNALGFEVYSQNFSAKKLVSIDSKDAVVEGKNVYAILRAGRARSTESIVLSSPFQEDGDNVYGAAVMLSLAKYFGGQNYWAKDLIFLVTSHGSIGMQAWIDQYLGIYSAGSGIVSSSLPGRSGAIQAAINLEIPSNQIQHANIIIEGVNGILPNLDLVNVVVYLCHSEKISSAFHSRWEWLGPSQFLDVEHQRALYTTAAMALHQAPGLPLGGHAHFLQHRIDSLTLRAVGRSTVATSTGNRDLVGVARALEGTFRSINNLLETLHHSEFFYFTSAMWRFISIGLYMPTLGLLLAPLILEALSQWLQARSPPPSGLPSQLSSPPPFPFGSVLTLFLSCYGSGVLLYSSALLGTRLLAPLDSQGLLLCLSLPLILPVLLLLVVRSSTAPEHWRMAKAMALVSFLLTQLALSVVNFSLAIMVSLLLTPPTILAQPLLRNRGPWIFQTPRLLLMLFFSPPLALTLLSSLYLFLPASTATPSLVLAGARLLLTGTGSALNAWAFHGCWLFPLVCLGVWPLWLMAWTLCTQREAAATTTTATATADKLHTD